MHRDGEYFTREVWEDGGIAETDKSLETIESWARPILLKRNSTSSMVNLHAMMKAMAGDDSNVEVEFMADRDPQIKVCGTKSA